MMMTVREADAPHALEGRLVPDVAAERVARIRGIGDDPTGAHDLSRTADEARLWGERV